MAENSEFPGVDQPYAIEERPPGVRFYQAKTSFWLPYHLMLRMEFKLDRVKLVFAVEDVVIEGRGLHPLYVKLAEQAVSWVVEQGERYAALVESGMLIARIKYIPHPKSSKPEEQEKA